MHSKFHILCSLKIINSITNQYPSHLFDHRYLPPQKCCLPPELSEREGTSVTEVLGASLCVRGLYPMHREVIRISQLPALCNGSH